MEGVIQASILILWWGVPALAFIIAGLLLTEEKGYFRTPGVAAFTAMVATASVTLAMTLGNTFLVDDPHAEWGLGLVLIVVGGILSALLAAVAIYWAGRGWVRRGLFTLSAGCLLGIGIPVFMAIAFGGLLLFLPVFFALLVYIAMAVGNPPLRPSEV